MYYANELLKNFGMGDIEIVNLDPLKIIKKGELIIDWEVEREPESVQKVIDLVVKLERREITLKELLEIIGNDILFHPVLRKKVLDFLEDI